jgi:hypothetical protein
MSEIQRFMGCIVFAGRPANAVPPQYASLLSPDAAWAALEAEFTKQACSLLGQVGRWEGCSGEARRNSKRGPCDAKGPL